MHVVYGTVQLNMLNSNIFPKFCRVKNDKIERAAERTTKTHSGRAERYANTEAGTCIPNIEHI